MRRDENGGGTFALEVKILDMLSLFIKNINSIFSPKFDSTTVAFGGDVQRTEGEDLRPKTLCQQGLKQPLDLPLALGHPPPQRLDPRHYARKLFLQVQRWKYHLYPR